MNNQCDVLIIGGGPAGTTIGSFLSQKGWKVTLLEKDCHPRFHIGESLLPMNLPILERLGVLQQVEKIGVVKRGAEFNSKSESTRRSTIYFRKAMDKSHPLAYQVKRSEFDEILFRNCQRIGVNALEGVRVRNVEFRPGDRHLVQAQHESGESTTWETRFVIDASGRDTLLAKRFNIKEKNPHHNSAAIFGHFSGVQRRDGKDQGNISIYWFDHGWFWMIPLQEDVMSVGAVCFPDYLKTRRSSAKEFLWDTIRQCEGVRERMKNARLISEAQATGNYAYTSQRAHGDGYLLVGDAFAFIDPVFSSGVYLAMSTAEFGADTVDGCLRNPAKATQLLSAHERRVRKGISLFSWFIYRFNTPAMHHLFMNKQNRFRIEEAMTSLLAGDVFRDTPLRRPIAIFKLLYYGIFMKQLAKSWASYKRRAKNATMIFTGGTTQLDKSDINPELPKPASVQVSEKKLTT
ncbi:MAG: tryptophan 7-halogenase [Gammaproteobacteria bacterium]|nr:tryptophan 7-halogenase [Gammaproteobacteria bacterium]